MTPADDGASVVGRWFAGAGGPPRRWSLATEAVAGLFSWSGRSLGQGRGGGRERAGRDCGRRRRGGDGPRRRHGRGSNRARTRARRDARVPPAYVRIWL